MIAARQALDLRPRLERLDALILRSAGLDPAALTSRFRPLWQQTAAEKAAVALQKAQATQIYAALGLWDPATTARLVQSQLVEDGVYPGAAEVSTSPPDPPSDTIPSANARERFATDFSIAYLTEPRDPWGRWTKGVGEPSDTTTGSKQPRAPDGTTISLASHHGDDPTDEGVKEPVEEEDEHPVSIISGVTAGHKPGEVERLVPPPPGGLGQGFPASRLPPASASVTPATDPAPKLSAAETEGLRLLFKGGGDKGSVAGAKMLLDRISAGQVAIPPGVTRRTLEKYADVARQAIADGIDKLGVQELRLKSINLLLGRSEDDKSNQ